LPFPGAAPFSFPMNQLQTFLARANVQVRDVIQEAVTLALDPEEEYTGTFGDPVVIPVMTRTGYEDHLITPLKIERVQFSAWTAEELNTIARTTLVRDQTGRTFFIQAVDYTEAVVYTFILTDREL
jgi:hypothetical protein